MQLQRLVVKPEQLQNGHLCLALSQQHYLQRVLRLSEGDRFIVMDGHGHAWLAKLVLASLEYQAEVLEPIAASTELLIRVTLVAALPKGNGFDEVVRQATELGVDQIIPVISDRTLLHPSSQKLERWQRIANEAAEQSERLCVPRIAEPIPFTKHFQESQHSPSDRSTKKYLCVARGEAHHLLGCLQSAKAEPSVDSITVAIGPEGGWTKTEIEGAIATGYQPVSLGDPILRAVTAPLVALSLIAAVWNEGARREE